VRGKRGVTILIAFCLLLCFFPPLASAGRFAEHTIAGDFNGATAVYAVDVDGDGDVDVLGAARYAGNITWWENDGSEGFTEHTISSTFNGAYSVYAIDVDGDSDVDVLGAAQDAGNITWWENDGAENFTEHTIDDSFTHARSVFAIDVDGDSDVDVLGAAYTDDDITWWENDGAENFTEHTIAGSFNGATSVFAIDVDGDSDVDVLGAGIHENNITWWENDGAESFTEHTIAYQFWDSNTVYAIDMDGDSDVDVVGGATGADTVTWWENDGSEIFTEHTISTTLYDVYSVYAIDVDGDGDVDVLDGATDRIIWWENDGSESFTGHTIAEGFGNAHSVYAIDVDGDGDVDVLGAADSLDDITWWENHFVPPNPKNLANTTDTYNSWCNFTWDAGTGVVTDSFNVSINGTWYNTSANTYYNNSGLLPYTWSNITVWAYNSTDGYLSDANISDNVQLGNNLPTTPTLIAPTDGNEGTDTTPSFNWTTSTDADGDSITYTLQIDNESGFTSPHVYENTTITNSNLTLPDADVLDDGLFYWRVRAYDSYDYSSWATYFNFTVDITAPVISNTNVTPSSVYEDVDVTISCDAVDAGVGMGSVWVRIKDSKDRETNQSLSLISGSTYSLVYGYTGYHGTFYILYFYANDSLGNEVAESSNLSFIVIRTGGGGGGVLPTPTVTPFPENCNHRCQACGYLSGLCRLDGCRCNEVDIARADCAENETCCCLKSLEPCPTAITTPPEGEPPITTIIDRILKPFHLLHEYLQRVFFYTPFMPDEINQTKQFPWNKIANKPLNSCIASTGECYIQPDDNFSIFIAYTESREEMWASKEFINITVYDIDDYPAWAKMDILIINLATYFEVPPEKWAVGDEAFWHYLFKYERDINNEWWMTGVRLWWIILTVLTVVIGVFGEERKKKKRKGGQKW